MERRGLLAIAGDADALSPHARVHHAVPLHPAGVELPPVPIGATFLDHWLAREGPGDISWRAERYECMAPATFILSDVIAHSPA